MRTKTFIALSVLALGACFLLALLGYLAFMYQNAFNDANSQWTRAKVALTRNFMLYGNLVSADSTQQLLTISTPDPYKKDGTITYRLALLPDAFVGRQETMTPDSGPTVVSSTTPIRADSVWALTPGTRMKFLIVPHGSGAAIGFLLVGNPF